DGLSARGPDEPAARAGDGCPRFSATALQPRPQLDRRADAGAVEQDGSGNRRRVSTLRLSGAPGGAAFSDRSAAIGGAYDGHSFTWSLPMPAESRSTIGLSPSRPTECFRSL